MCLCVWIVKKQKYFYTIGAIIALGALIFYFSYRVINQKPVSLSSEADRCNSEVVSVNIFTNYAIASMNKTTTNTTNTCNLEPEENDQILHHCLSILHVTNQCLPNDTLDREFIMNQMKDFI